MSGRKQRTICLIRYAAPARIATKIGASSAFSTTAHAANITGVFSNQFNVVSGSACTGTTTNTFGECLSAVPSFGTPSSTNINGGPGSRILQLAVKFIF